MTDVRIEHTFNCDENTFWDKIFFSEQFNRLMYLEHLQFKQWQIADFRESDTTINRTVLSNARGDLPGTIIAHR